MTLFLLLSLCTLCIGPLGFELFSHQETAFRFIDTFVMVAIGGLVLFHVLPESFSIIGYIALAGAFIGLLAPMVLKRLFHHNECEIHRSLISIATLGIVAHAILDGIALAGIEHGHSQSLILGLAIILHRIPEGIGIWRIARFGVGFGFALMAFMGLAFLTVVGFFFAQPIVSLVSEYSLAVFQCLMGGILLHVVFHQHSLPHADGHENHHHVGMTSFASLFGGSCAIVVLAVLALLSLHH